MSKWQRGKGKGKREKEKGKRKKGKRKKEKEGGSADLLIRIRKTPSPVRSPTFRWSPILHQVEFEANPQYHDAGFRPEHA